MLLNYQKICQELTQWLPQRQKDIILRRFALSAIAPGEGGVKGETLETIGKNFGITRERVRQIEEDGLEKIKSKIEGRSITNLQKTFEYFNQYLKKFGNLRKEDTILRELGGEKEKAQVYFLLTLGENFKRLGETDEFYSLWVTNQNSFLKAKEIINTLHQKLKKLGKPLTLKEISSFYSFENPILESYLEISKNIQKNQDSLFGLKDWPEINPRGVRDKAYLAFKKAQKPLHFSEVASLIDGAFLQTVHNELIRDQRFILVGRGTYALAEWGYYPGQVREVIYKVLKEAKKPLTKEKILEKVLKQRLVKKNTIFLNLSNKEYFLRNSQGKYEVKKA